MMSSHWLYELMGADGDCSNPSALQQFEEPIMDLGILWDHVLYISAKYYIWTWRSKWNRTSSSIHYDLQVFSVEIWTLKVLAPKTGTQVCPLQLAALCFVQWVHDRGLLLHKRQNRVSKAQLNTEHHIRYLAVSLLWYCLFSTQYGRPCSNTVTPPLALITRRIENPKHYKCINQSKHGLQNTTVGLLSNTKWIPSFYRSYKNISRGNVGGKCVQSVRASPGWK